VEGKAEQKETAEKRRAEGKKQQNWLQNSESAGEKEQVDGSVSEKRRR